MTFIGVPKPAHVDITGTVFKLYADRYRAAARVCLRHARKRQQFDPVPYQLLCQSIELHLKSFVWLVDRTGWDGIRKKYKHDLVKLWLDSKAKGMHRYVRMTPLRDSIIDLVGPYYRERKFTYLDLDMIVGPDGISPSGLDRLRKEPRALPVLSRLAGALSTALHRPILAAP